MAANNIRKILQDLGNSTILTTKRKYFLEVSLLLIVCILLINYFSPKSNALYFLLLFPIILGAIFIIYLVSKVLERPEMGIPIIAFFLPFERIGALTYASFNLRLTQVFTVLTFIAYTFYVIFTDKKNHILGIRIKKDASFYILILFSIITIASIVDAINKSRSLFVLSFDLFIFFTYILISNLFVSKDILRKTVWALLGVSLIVCLYGVFQFIAGTLNLPTAISGLREGYTKVVFGFPRVQATESEPQFWGNFLIIPVSLSLSVLVVSLGRKQRQLFQRSIPFRLIFISTLVFILCLINLLMTFSRGAWYSAAFSVGLVILFNIKRILNVKVIITSAILLTVIITGFIFVLHYTHSPITLETLTQRATALEDSDRTITSNAALHYFSSHPILGIGTGSFGPYEAPNPYQIPSVYGQDIGWRIVNNEYLEILTENGIIGFSAFAVFILVIIFNVFNALKKKTDVYTKTVFIGFIAAFAGLLLQYSAFSTLYVMQVWFTFAIVNAIAFNINHKIWTFE